ncbi:hypothetical protein HUF15_04885 [Streptomyces samsunensis]|uniref:DUF320 domain-containing protein n=3 Tax=Streptomyces TaxID=1883 RepID=A0ABX6W3P7_STRMQ|nr:MULTISPECIES: hypothetical protein [Streptomyces]AQA09847.1 hypothetical protein BV401_04405 [Streptomyces autolyticus]ATL80380.1 hypothetical protein SMALA_0134 [Streptomyces malaysiensis]AUA16248.1 hypothetical protein CFP59_08438 [Streptomyces sp. M56]MCC4314107.1 hypothetical protein [Streptomyces malaysiensis]MCD9587348.1 hypothetical protein [Streptomyces sp. 8ZJF_21]
MQIVKKAALLAATAGTLALLGTGTAVADGHGRNFENPSTTFNLSSFIFQNNECDTATGTTAVTSAAAPTGDVNIGSTCLNVIGG